VYQQQENPSASDFDPAENRRRQSPIDTVQANKVYGKTMQLPVVTAKWLFFSRKS